MRESQVRYNCTPVPQTLSDEPLRLPHSAGNQHHPQRLVPCRLSHWHLFRRNMGSKAISGSQHWRSHYLPLHDRSSYEKYAMIFSLVKSERS
jgi:hypothetical protein